uniref:uncharacterized protein LOC124024493 n=1 Tax=Oncorhynchus gorbuscha TaxID=8017 RepID=UPI001EAF8A66|nr:uncharacterized protein LOC124024493 [Oncorhynchus gorbuscha]
MHDTEDMPVGVDFDEEEPSFSDPEDFEDDVDDEELLGDLLREKPQEADGIDSVVVVDNVPQVGPERLEKLKNVIHKIFSKFGKITNEFYPTVDGPEGLTKGYIFLEYPTQTYIRYLFIPSQDRSILGVAYDSERWRVAGQWEDPSVRIGWIHGLSNMMRHTQAFHFLDQAGLTKPLLQLQTDPSLFVASAANHLLARLLTFHQPATTSHTTQGNGLTVPPNKEEVELDITMETSPGSGCSITMEILKHLEISLESDSHTQVLQGLRLLALTLPELEAPLRGSVIRRVLRPLEGLVREGRRAVAQPLMDVLLATYRSGPCDSRLVSLMASMLNSQNPSDAALCAAATLHPETCPPGLRQKIVAVLLGPLQMVTGVTLLDWPNDRHTDQQTDHRHTDQQTDHRHTDQQTDNRQTDTDQDRQTEGRSSLSLLLDHLNHKPSCVSLLCVSVSSAPYITDMDSSASVILAVVSL